MILLFFCYFWLIINLKKKRCIHCDLQIMINWLDSYFVFLLKIMPITDWYKSRSNQFRCGVTWWYNELQLSYTIECIVVSSSMNYSKQMSEFWKYRYNVWQQWIEKRNHIHCASLVKRINDNYWFIFTTAILHLKKAVYRISICIRHILIMLEWNSCHMQMEIL